MYPAATVGSIRAGDTMTVLVTALLKGNPLLLIEA